MSSEDSTLNYDTSLTKTVYRENVNDCHISGFINRFGGLTVFVFDQDFERIYQGDNILKARDAAWKHR